MMRVDYREKHSGVPEELEKLGVEFQYDTLEVGDYVVSEDICVERKSSNDFISSIIDKRLFEQARLLARAYRNPLIVVEGSFFEALKFRKIGYPQIYGAVAALVDIGVKLLFTENYRETAHVIYALYERAAQVGAQFREKSIEKRNKSIEVVQLNMLASIPGIDRELAHRILMHFKTPRRFFKASPSELRKVEGLGHARIVKIVEALNKVYVKGRYEV